MKNQKGFIQIPLLIAIIAGVLVLGGGGYFGIKQYRNYQVKKVEQERIALEKERESQEQAEAQRKALEQTQTEIKNLREKSVKIQEKQSALEKQAQVIAEKPQIDLPAIIASWHTAVARVVCIYSDGSVASGSGLLWNIWLTSQSEPKNIVVTNKHVINDDDGYLAERCYFKLPLGGNIYNEKGVSEMRLSIPGVDVGYLIPNNPDSYLSSIARPIDEHTCKDNTAIGESVVILGYPSIGAKDDVTATEGIISGIDGDYYITSAKVDHGNSGGAAVRIRDNCYIGIPTFVSAGTLESLARIFDWRVIAPKH